MDNVKLATNVIPKGMSYDEMVRGYQDLHFELFSDAGIAGRVRSKLAHLKNPVAGHRHPVREAAGICARLAWRGLSRGGPRRWWYFLTSLPWTRPQLLQQAIEDWIVGLSMRDYIDRHFRPAEAPAQARLNDYLRELEHALARYQHAGALELSFPGAAGPSLRLSGLLDRRFFVRATRLLERLLRDTRAPVTLHIDDLHEGQVRRLQRLLRRLSRYGDRIRITVNEKVRPAIHVDSSVFHLGFEA